MSEGLRRLQPRGATPEPELEAPKPSRPVVQGDGWQFAVPQGWAMVDQETARIVARELNDGESETGVETVLVREGVPQDAITLMSMEIDEEWMDEASVREMGAELSRSVAESYQVEVSAVDLFRVDGQPAAAWNYWIGAGAEAMWQFQWFFVADSKAYYLIASCGSRETDEAKQAMHEVVGGWGWVAGRG